MTPTDDPPVNRAGCLVCGDVVTSTHRHDFVRCSCGALAVDGGQAYLRRAGNPAKCVELPFAADLAGWDELRADMLRKP